MTDAGDLSWVVWPIVLPLAAAPLTFVCTGRALAPLAVAASAGVLLSVAALAWRVATAGVQRHRVGGWGAPLGIDLAADGLSTMLLLVTAVTGAVVSAHAHRYFSCGRRDPHAPHDAARFWPLWLFLWGGLNGVFLSQDLFNLYVSLELVMLAAVALVALAGTHVAVSAALRYLLAAMLGSMLYLMAVALVYASAGTLSLEELARDSSPRSVPGPAVALLTVGLLLKSALFPLHFWLPAAHANAPAPVSALLSGLVVKASVYVIWRLSFQTFAGAMPASAASLLAVLGAGAIVWGSIQALQAPRIKPLVAYSTVAQLGYLFLAFPLVGARGGLAAWQACALFAASHAFAKAAFFMAAGNIHLAAGHDRISALDGIGARLPRSFLAAGLASVALMGLPPSGAFMAKWMMMRAAIEAGHAWLAGVMLLGGVLAAGYCFRVLARAFAPPSDVPLGAVPRRLEHAALILAVVALAAGLLVAPALRLLEVGSPVWTVGDVRP